MMIFWNPQQLSPASPGGELSFFLQRVGYLYTYIPITIPLPFTEEHTGWKKVSTIFEIPYAVYIQNTALFLALIYQALWDVFICWCFSANYKTTGFKSPDISKTIFTLMYFLTKCMATSKFQVYSSKPFLKLY